MQTKKVRSVDNDLIAQKIFRTINSANGIRKFTRDDVRHYRSHKLLASLLQLLLEKKVISKAELKTLLINCKT